MEGERVQNIAKNSKNLDTIPQEFIRLENEQPSITTVHGSILQVPPIDLGRDDGENNLVELISNASQEWGLFQVINHGIPNDVIAKLQNVGKEFFELPQEEKEIIAKPTLGHKNDDNNNNKNSNENSNNNNNEKNDNDNNDDIYKKGDDQGYGTKLQKEVHGKRGWVDHLFHNVWPPSVVDYNFWPQSPPSYREANEEYTKHLIGVGNKLLMYMSRGLGLEDNVVKETGGGEGLVYLLKINYYPPCPRPDLALGVVAHTDMSVLTILVPNHVPGLQVSRDGLWYNVKYIPNALIIHVGDQMEIMSNGKYKAVLHRSTVNKDETRMSWPVFIEPPPEHEVGPIPKLISDENPAKYKTKKYSDYKYCKLNKLPQ